MIPFSRLSLTALALAALALPAHAQTTLTYSTWIPPLHHISVWQAKWTAEVEKATDGRVKFQALAKHPSAPPGTFDAIRDGLTDLSYTPANYTPARHVVALLPELPGSGDTATTNSVAYWRIHAKHLHKVGEYKGVKLIGVFTHGPGQIFTKKPIARFEDLKGLKFRTAGGVAERVATAIGASPFVKPASESYELLSTGVADGVFFSLDAIPSFKLETVLGQGTLFPGGIYNAAFGFLMNEEKWNKISKQDQVIIEKLGGEHLARTVGKSWDDVDRSSLESLKRSNVKVVYADAVFAAEVQKRSAPIVDDWIKRANAKGIDAKRVLDEFRAELKNLAAEK
jgi:TRAP-type C4-dicarboxylate transport system substrate-binding protein